MGWCPPVLGMVAHVEYPNSTRLSPRRDETQSYSCALATEMAHTRDDCADQTQSYSRALATGCICAAHCQSALTCAHDVNMQHTDSYLLLCTCAIVRASGVNITSPQLTDPDEHVHHLTDQSKPVTLGTGTLLDRRVACRVCTAYSQRDSCGSQDRIHFQTLTFLRQVSGASSTGPDSKASRSACAEHPQRSRLVSLRGVVSPPLPLGCGRGLHRRCSLKLKSAFQAPVQPEGTATNAHRLACRTRRAARRNEQQRGDIAIATLSTPNCASLKAISFAKLTTGTCSEHACSHVRETKKKHQRLPQRGPP